MVGGYLPAYHREHLCHWLHRTIKEAFSNDISSNYFDECTTTLQEVADIDHLLSLWEKKINEPNVASKQNYIDSKIMATCDVTS